MLKQQGPIHSQITTDPAHFFFIAFVRPPIIAFKLF